MQMLIAPKLIQFRLKRIGKKECGVCVCMCVCMFECTLCDLYNCCRTTRTIFTNDNLPQRRGNLVSSDFHPMRNKMWIKFSLQPNQLFFHSVCGMSSTRFVYEIGILLSLQRSVSVSLFCRSLVFTIFSIMRSTQRAMTVQPMCLDIHTYIFLSNLNECAFIWVFCVYEHSV